jgi:hypothetical protein
LSEREVPAGLVHHSDSGVQYAAGGYTRLLKVPLDPVKRMGIGKYNVIKR